MKTLPIASALLALALMPALPDGSVASANTHFCGSYARWADHHDPESARLAITTEDGKVTLLLTDRVVAMQLSARSLHKVDRELRDAERRQDNWVGAVIASAVVGTVRGLIDGSIEYRISDLRDVTYEDGRLRFIGRNGRPIFRHVRIDDEDLADAFSERDARRFVDEFRRVKAERVYER